MCMNFNESSLSTVTRRGCHFEKVGDRQCCTLLRWHRWDKPHKIWYSSRQNTHVSNKSQLPDCCEWLRSVLIVARRTDKILWFCPFCYELAQLFLKRVTSLAVLGESAGQSPSCLQGERSLRAEGLFAGGSTECVLGSVEGWHSHLSYSLWRHLGAWLVFRQESSPGLVTLCFLLPFSNSKQVHWDEGSTRCLSLDSP